MMNRCRTEEKGMVKSNVKNDSSNIPEDSLKSLSGQLLGFAGLAHREGDGIEPRRLVYEQLGNAYD